MTQTLTTEKLKWLHDAATELSATKLKMTMRPDELLVLTSELLANREAQPVGFYTTVSGRGGVVWHNGAPADDTAIYTAPPAPVVNPELTRAPEVDEQVLLEQFKQWWSSKERGFTIINADLQKELQWEAWQDCRAAMLAQPVSQGYKLPDNVQEALTLALHAMEFMGDTLNSVDAVCTEDVEYVTPAFTAIRGLLAAAPEGGNEN